MSGRIALREELTAHAMRQAERSQRMRRAKVTGVSPLTVEMFDSTLVLTEDDDFWLSQWARFYNTAVGIEVDDVVLLHQQEDWVLTDVITDKDVVQALNTWKSS